MLHLPALCPGMRRWCILATFDDAAGVCQWHNAVRATPALVWLLGSKQSGMLVHFWADQRDVLALA